ncbi:MAG: erythrose-4-phosphate dehydrogenase [Gammaproteobacteria bacterium]|nr:MAG: erythrose-4-phosphate dehydrogenase [Gammaproteobacteria bacterium]
MKIAINGFGRIGRNVCRALIERALFNDIEIVAINDIADAHTLVHLLNYDSTYGRLTSIGVNASIVNKNDGLVLQLTKYTQDTLHNRKSKIIAQIAILDEKNPQNLPWEALKVDVVLECSGQFRLYKKANLHRVAGAKQVVISAAPFDEVDACVVVGVNDAQLSLDLPIISGVSCTTQALVPLIATLDTAFGVESAMMTEIHAVTADQNVLDQAHRDLRRARAAGYNIIPTTSSSIAATEKVLPNLVGRINGYSMRVPTIDVAAIDVTFNFTQQVTLDDVKSVLQQASKDELSGIMGYTTKPLVSSDFVHQCESLIVDDFQLLQVGKQIKVFAWYDNEWGYANRLVDMCMLLKNK